MTATFKKRFETFLCFAISLVIAGCRCTAHDSESNNGREPVSVNVESTSPEPETPQVLYLPDSGTELSTLEGVRARAQLTRRCPPEMVDIEGEYCIDRFEAVLVDSRQERRLSPYYHPTRAQTRATYRRWKKRWTTAGSAQARRMPIPDPPGWQLEEDFEPKAEVRSGEIPNGYLSGEIAELACRNAGKRLCTEEEWVRACRGQSGHKYPYGSDYRYGVCNVFGPEHPANVLHNDSSIEHLDPRLNQVKNQGQNLLRRTGETPECASRWGNDAVFDMVGNLDEWVDDPDGKFLGGFYARSTREGCEASVSVHGLDYFDYSLGVRCCR